jgi:acyl carrier protein
MFDEIRQFVIDSLTDMNYDVRGLQDDETLGPAGLDLESLVLAELAFRVEDRFGIKFAEDESEELAGLTVGEFCAMVESRRQGAATVVGD